MGGGGGGGGALAPYYSTLALFREGRGLQENGGNGHVKSRHLKRQEPVVLPSICETEKELCMSI